MDIYFKNKYIHLQKQIYYYSYNHDKNLTKGTDSTTIGIELCNIPQLKKSLFFV